MSKIPETGVVVSLGSFSQEYVGWVEGNVDLALALETGKPVVLHHPMRLVAIPAPPRGVVTMLVGVDGPVDLLYLTVTSWWTPNTEREQSYREILDPPRVQLVTPGQAPPPVNGRRVH